MRCTSTREYSELEPPPIFARGPTPSQASFACVTCAPPSSRDGPKATWRAVRPAAKRLSAPGGSGGRAGASKRGSGADDDVE